jgi:PAS domain S-box-containing protein
MAKIKKNENISSENITSLFSFNSAEKESDFAEKIFNTVREPLLLLDKDLRVIKASRSFYDFFKVTSNKTIGKLIYDLGNHQWNIPKLRELLETILPEKTTFDNYEVEHDFSKIGKRIMLLNARKIPRGLSEEQMILLAIEDITERKQKEESLSEKSRLNNKYLEILLDHAHMPIIIWDSSNIIIRINNEFEKLIGYDWAELRGKKIDFLFPKESLDSTLELLKSKESDEKIEIIEIDILLKDKNIKTVIWNSANLYDKKGKRIVATIAQDITYRKRAEEALSESERLFHSLAQVSPVGIFKTNAEGYTTYVNPKWSQLSGLSNEYALGFGWLRAVHPDDRKKLSKGWHESTKIQKVSYSEYRFLHPDGTVVWVMGQATPELDSENKIIGYIGTITDITDRKLAEVKLQESETRYRRLHDSITDCFVQTKMSGEIVDINHSFIEMIGYSKKELLKLRYQDITPARWQEFETRIVNEQILPRGYSDVYEKEYIKKDGTVLPVELKTYLLHDSKGNNSHFWALVRDITKRIEAEKALKESEERFRSLYENSTIGLYRTTPGGKIILANATLVKMLGYSSFEELAERNLDEDGFEPTYERKLFLEQIERDGEVKGLESAWTSKNGSEVFLRESAKAIRDSDGKTLYYDGTVEDITERKFAEKALGESEKSYKDLINGMNETVWVIDFSGNLLEVNDTAIKVLGYSKEELLTIGLFGIDSSLKKEDISALVKSMPEDKLQIFETSHTTKDGRTIPVEVYSSLATYQGKEVILSIARDITERKRAEEEVLILAQSLKSIHESVSITDLEDKIIFVNESFLKTYGYSESEIVGKNMNIVRSRNNSPEIIKEILPATLKGRWSGELWNKRKDGSEFPVYLSTTVINDKTVKLWDLLVLHPTSQNKNGVREN